MLNLYQTAIIHQFEAALCQLDIAIDRCPDDAWEARVGDQVFGQVAFHATFYADLYLGRDIPSQRAQRFHIEHAAEFADYEELEDREPVRRYDKAFVRSYIQHCRAKATESLMSETEETLAGPSCFRWYKFNRAEMHMVNIRHIQEHVGELAAQIRLAADRDVPWVGSGWRNV